MVKCDHAIYRIYVNMLQISLLLLFNLMQPRSRVYLLFVVGNSCRCENNGSRCAEPWLLSQSWWWSWYNQIAQSNLGRGRVATPGGRPRSSRRAQLSTVFARWRQCERPSNTQFFVGYPSHSSLQETGAALPFFQNSRSLPTERQTDKTKTELDR